MGCQAGPLLGNFVSKAGPQGWSSPSVAMVTCSRRLPEGLKSVLFSDEACCASRGKQRVLKTVRRVLLTLDHWSLPLLSWVVE